MRPYEARTEASAASGLARTSRSVANQIRTVARHRILRVLGRTEPAELEAVPSALRIQLGL